MRAAARLAFVLLALPGPGLLAQPTASGNIYGRVTDASGAPLPGAAITLSSDAGTRATTADPHGDFRLLAVPHGTHQLTVAVAGFSTVERSVVMAIGHNVELVFELKVAPFEETLSVTEETPVVDSKKFGNLTTLDKDELAAIPTARDLWATLQTVAGVEVDRVNVGGKENGSQGSFHGKGADPKNNVWAIDGLVITDMASFGGSSTFYTYDVFDQVSVATGGNDITLATGAVGIGFVTRRGTNQWRGNAVGYLTHDAFQSSNLPDELVGDPRLQGSDKADHTEQIADYNFDLGGPILKDRLWIYGSWGRQDIRYRRLTQTQDKTELLTGSAKLNWQASSKDMISGFWFNGVKNVIGRSQGSGLLEPDESLLDQVGLFPRQPPGLSKIEWQRTFSPNLFLTAKWAYFSNGFALAGRGDQDPVFDFRTSRVSGSATSQNFLRPQTTWQLDGHYFRAGLGGSHQLRFGASYRRAGSLTEIVPPGQKTQARLNTNFQDRARFFRDTRADAESKYYALYAADTFTRKRLNVTLGLRLDFQQGYAKASSVEANPLIPALLPGIDFPGGGGAEWTDLSPRVGLTYALGASRRTIARVSLARYAGQLQNSYVTFGSRASLRAFLEYPWRDQNGDRRIQTSEVDFATLTQAVGVDTANPGALSTPDRIDPDLSSDNDYELVLGADREMAGDLRLGLSYTWRRNVDTFTRGVEQIFWTPRIGVTSDDYALGTPVTRNGYTVTPYVLKPEVTTRPGVTGGSFLTQRPDFHRQYHGLDLTLMKRLSRRWMARVAVSYMDWRDRLESPLGHHANPNPVDIDPGMDGGVVMRPGPRTPYMGGRWQVAANALYQVGRGYELAANVFARQGYPKPIYIQVNTGAFEGTSNVLAVPKGDTERLPDIYQLDLSLAKSLRLGGTSLSLRLECFNVLNASTELFRIVNAGSAAFGRIEEIMAPRIFRLGARVGF